MTFRSSLSFKVFAAVFATASLLVAGMTITSIWRVDRNFSRYVQQLEMKKLEPLVNHLQQQLADGGNWNFIPVEDERRYHDWLARNIRPDNRQERELPTEAPGGEETPDGFNPIDRQNRPPFNSANTEPPFPPRRPPDVLSISRRLAIFDEQGHKIAGAAVSRQECITLPVLVNGQLKGFVGLQKQTNVLASSEKDFLRDQLQDALKLGGIALLVSALVSLLFARHLKKPVRDLVDTTQALTEGRFDTRLKEDRHDEFGLLAQHLNHMAEQLAVQEQNRREWLASTSHELRTPLTVMRALVEALQEGVRQPDANTLNQMLQQVMSMTKLAGDLQQLAQYEAGALRLDRHPAHPKALIEDILEAQRDRLAHAGIVPELIDHTDNMIVSLDLQRFSQLVMNLVENTLRYTDSPGQLRISLQRRGNAWRAEFSDSSPGVSTPALPKLFERFYRVEASRNRASGGAGLGLAICRAIVEAHQGKIEARPSPLGGLSIIVTLPV